MLTRLLFKKREKKKEEEKKEKEEELEAIKTPFEMVK